MPTSFLFPPPDDDRTRPLIVQELDGVRAGGGRVEVTELVKLGAIAGDSELIRERYRVKRLVEAASPAVAEDLCRTRIRITFVNLVCP